MALFDGAFEGIGGVRFGIGPMIGRVIGPILGADEIRRREMETALAKAKLGEQAVQDGLQKGDNELRMLGAAMVTTALIQVEDPGTIIVPPEVSEEVTHIAAALPRSDVEKNPFISEHDANTAMTILDGTDHL